MKLPTQTQAFNDGVAKFYSVGNIAQPGNMPKDGIALRLNNPLPYEERTVGMSRFWTAKQEQTKIERLLRFPKVNNVRREDIVIPIDGEQYRIVQVQYPPNMEPLCMDLSLERLEVAYEIN